VLEAIRCVSANQSTEGDCAADFRCTRRRHSTCVRVCAWSARQTLIYRLSSTNPPAACAIEPPRHCWSPRQQQSLKPRAIDNFAVSPTAKYNSKSLHTESLNARSAAPKAACTYYYCIYASLSLCKLFPINFFLFPWRFYVISNDLEQTYSGQVLCMNFSYSS